MKLIEKKPHIFGIRHLSPGGAYHLLQFLDDIKPTAVLIEGLSDANSQIGYFTSRDTQPPVAILAYTEELPIRTLLYPFVNYSPEYQALLWAKKHCVHAEFIDLPSDVFLPLEYQSLKGEDERFIEKKTIINEFTNEHKDDYKNKSKNKFINTSVSESIYNKWLELTGEEEYDSYWEYNFEHNLNKNSYRLAANEFGKSLREILQDSEYEYAKNLVREAYMRRRICKAVDAGHQIEKIVVVTGAYHTLALRNDLEPMSDEELKRLPRVKTRLTLMPYSYYRLSSGSGYGAGNNAPAYYGMMWECMNQNDITKFPAQYLSRITSYLRKNGTYCSSAEVIESLRLANTLAALHSGSAPSLRDLRDATVTCLGHGELSVVAEAIAHTNIGISIGSLPDGVRRTSIQDDFYRELKRLKLEKYKSTVAMELKLDLRENRRVKSKENAFLDLNRSFFLHRLKVLRISFQKLKPSFQQSATWAELWVLRWTPEAEIELVESILRGETVEIATAYVFKEWLDKCVAIQEVAEVIREACECGMMEAMEQARKTLQRLAVEESSFNDISLTVFELSIVISYGDIRKFEVESLIPLLQQLFLRGTLLMVDAAKCDNNAAKVVIESIRRMNRVSLEHFKLIDKDFWVEKLIELSNVDDKNPLLSGYACSILLERNLLDEEILSQEISRRLSPGVDADLGAGWFEGFSMCNHYALLAKMGLWKQLVEYVASLDSEQFKRTLVFLRRAFGDFTLAEKHHICDNLGEIWGVNKEEASDILSRKLNEEEQNKINDINEFDFDDI
ncbi:MAG: DUF5682 family protein [Clostridia bacterium]|nr:DUF5682 family protein [Clostridia bacterium]